MIDDFRRPPSRQPVRIDAYHRGTLPPPTSAPAVDMAIAEQPYVQPVFRTPEQVAAQDEHLFLPAPGIAPEMLPEHAVEPPKKGLKAVFKKPTRKQAIILAVLAVLIIGGGTAYVLTRQKPAPAPVKRAPVAVAPVEKPKPILSPLTGLPATTEQLGWPVTAVMIENSSDARPQSGLQEAGIVFEAIAEYGITRFMALYQENAAPNIGPIRSARPYYLDWAMAFDANYAHVGGSPDALARIRELGIRDLDQFYNSGAYRRISARYAPHNVYSTIPQLHAIAAPKGYTKSNYIPFKRTEKEGPAKVPSVKTINLAISSAFYNVRYDYDAASNSYKRSMGGAPHVDNESKAQLSPKVVVALEIPYSLMADGYHSQYQTVGSGNMLLFQDGIAIPGTWSKAGPKDQFIFKDGAGAEMKLNPGQTWITALGSITQATYGQ